MTSHYESVVEKAALNYLRESGYSTYRTPPPSGSSATGGSR
jgi:hypothetical protein